MDDPINDRFFPEGEPRSLNTAAKTMGCDVNDLLVAIRQAADVREDADAAMVAVWPLHEADAEELAHAFSAITRPYPLPVMLATMARMLLDKAKEIDAVLHPGLRLLPVAELSIDPDAEATDG